MAGSDIRKASTKDASVIRQGHTTNGAFGSDPTRKVKGNRSVRDISTPTAK